MYAVRRKDGHPKPFRVGDREYVGAHWKLEQELTPEHEFAAEHGTLAIVEVADVSDPRLMPFPVENPADLAAMETAVDPAELLQRLGAREARIVALESQVLQLEGTIHTHEAVIAGLQGRVAQLSEVQTPVATFPGGDTATAVAVQA